MSEVAAEAWTPEDALLRLADILREEERVLSDQVVPAAEQPALGILCAAGPRASHAPAEYALVMEAVREGYLLHYGKPRVLAADDADLALLAGDYLYAQGIERLAGLGDSAAIAELADLISLAAEASAESRDDLAAPLWLGAAIAVGCGTSAAHEAAKEATRDLAAGAPEALLAATRVTAEAHGLGDALDRTADSIHFRLPERDANG